MRNLLLFLLFITSSLIVFSQTESFDFRQTKWGMSKDEVIKAESGNSYELKTESSAEYLQFFPVTLTNITGFANIIYKFTNNSLVSVNMILFYDFQGSNINCNNPLSLQFKIDLIQRNYVRPLLAKGYKPGYSWEAGGASDPLFTDDERGRNPMTDPKQIEIAYLERKKNTKYVNFPTNVQSPSLKSDRTNIYITYNYDVKGDPNNTWSDCNGIQWKILGSINAYANFSILKKDIKPDI